MNKHLIYLLIFGLFSTSFAQQSREVQLLQEIQNAYDQFNYTEAEIKAQTALKQYQRFTPSQLTEIHKILALIYSAQNKKEQAREHFEAALSINPDLELDPIYVSPKILNFFKKIKSEYKQNLLNSDENKQEIRYVLVQDPRPSAALRSMLIPGWGQWYKGEKSKGKILMGLWGGSVTGVIIAHIIRNHAEDRYLSETNPDKIESRFKTFDRWHKIRNNLLIFAAGIWVYSYLDAILNNHPLKKQAKSESFIQWNPAYAPGRLAVTLTINFNLNKFKK